MVISIHVPREGHDVGRILSAVSQGISIHVPREGHDPPINSANWSTPLFQSTCPARGTTI